jgi:hypothetical protein
VVDLMEKTFLPILRVSELVTQDPEGTRCITEPLGGFRRGKAFDEIGPQGLILAMKGVYGFYKEACFLKMNCYLIASTYRHIYIIAYSN